MRKGFIIAVAAIGLSAMLASSDGAISLLGSAALAQEGPGSGGGGHSGGGGGGGHGGGGKGHKGPDPRCPYQDHTGRGGYGPGSQGRRGHGGSGGDDHAGGGHGGVPGSAESSVASREAGVGGGGGGGENFLCDSPGAWNVRTKVFH